jgi:hypothetical protein
VHAQSRTVLGPTSGDHLWVQREEVQERRHAVRPAPRFLIRNGAFVEVEPRGFEPLTSCLQIGLILGRMGRELDGGLSASDRG